jgi:catechol 2,3-dioxygenase-like lactoylglutathione lyase family enzyme
MPLSVLKPALDLGIVLHDVDAMIVFYRDVLGLPEVGTFSVSGGQQHRYLLGESTIKLYIADNQPAVRSPGGGIQDATGIRYWTAFCSGLDEIVAECIAAGAPQIIPLTTSSTGVRYIVLADPDGNCFELIESPDIG